MKEKIFNFVFLLSVFLNLLLFTNYLNQPRYTLGKLRHEISVKGLFDGQYNNKVLFKLPKEMVVVDASPQGIAAAGVFEPNRIEFTIIVPANSVDYSQSGNIQRSDSIYSYK